MRYNSAQQCHVLSYIAVQALKSQIYYTKKGKKVIIPYGALFNALCILVGSCVGIFFGAKMSESMRRTVFQGIGLCVLMLGTKMAITTVNPLIVIFSILLGCVVGEMLNIEQRLLALATYLKRCLNIGNPRFSEGFVSASVLFCIGAMAILGSFDEGLRGDRTVVLSKAMLDGFASIALASLYGIGVLFAALTVLIYQGALTMGATLLQPWLPPQVMTELVAVGGILILGIALTLLELVRIPLSNMLPALPMVVLLAHYFA